MNIFIGNLSLNAIEVDLKRLFSPFGEINSVLLLRDKWSNRPKGSAVIDMPNAQQAELAINKLHKTSFGGKIISVTSTSYEEGYR
ncbi:MAG: RNA-binding protein [Chitinophagaceae bacterium]